MENFAELYKRAKERQKRAQLPHGDHEATKQRVRKAMKTMEELVVPQSPAEWAATLALGPIGGKAFKGAMLAAGAMASDDAEAAFIGPKGAANLGLDLFEKAQRLGLEGRSAEEIYRKTGTWISPSDGYRRLEVPSRESLKFKIDTPERAHYKTVGEIIDFPELFAAYPELAGMKMNLRPSKSGQSYMEKTDWDPAVFNIGTLSRYDNSINSRDHILSNIEHELQHYIQQVEDFARGDSLSRLKKTHGSLEGTRKYLQTPGEIEARAVGDRFYYTPRDLARQRPWDTYKFQSEYPYGELMP